MKTSIKAIIAVLITTLSLAVKAQSTGGVYLTEQDYKTSKLSYELKGDGKIKLNDFLGGSTITVVYQGKSTKLAKNEVFGYRLNNQDYRFFNNTAYKIVDAKGFFIYSHPKLAQQGKGLKPMDSYYFSNSANGNIQPLTIKALEVVYANNPKFKYDIEGKFRSDEDLIAYDNAIKEYKLKYLYDQSGQ